MAHHHLLSFLTLILLILSSSSHAAESPALFSNPPQFLSSGKNLTHGRMTLSLSNDCGLIIYRNNEPINDFQTNTTTSHCILKLNQYGQLVLHPSDERAPTQFIGEKGEMGDYAMLFVEDTLGIYGPAIWNNGVPIPMTIKQGKLKIGTSDNFIINGQTPNELSAQNGNAKAEITEQCSLSVTNINTGAIIWESSGEYENLRDCFLRLADNGDLFLIGFNGTSYVTQWSSGSPGANNLIYVAVLRFSGRISIYGLNFFVSGDVAAEKIKMVTA